MHVIFEVFLKQITKYSCSIQAHSPLPKKKKKTKQKDEKQKQKCHLSENTRVLPLNHGQQPPRFRACHLLMFKRWSLLHSCVEISPSLACIFSHFRQSLILKHEIKAQVHINVASII